MGQTLVMSNLMCLHQTLVMSNLTYLHQTLVMSDQTCLHQTLAMSNLMCLHQVLVMSTSSSELGSCSHLQVLGCCRYLTPSKMCHPHHRLIMLLRKSHPVRLYPVLKCTRPR